MKKVTPPGEVLPRCFYNRSPELVARELLGKLLKHRYRGEPLIGRVLEVEAYLGGTDAASHTFLGRTARNAVLFGPPGVAYVYFIYGLHYCFNVSCLPDGEPGGVLFRALLPLTGIATMARLRGLSETASPRQLAGGPGRLCEALGISRQTRNGVDVTLARSPLQILDDGYHPGAIEITPRIGIRKAADRPLRFVVAAGKMKMYRKNSSVGQ
jgi:DNA-3-methyladenine glycosylase